MKALVNILKEQLIEYKTLLDIAEKKQQVLIGNDIKELDRLNKEEHTIIIHITKLENQRLEIVNRLSEVWGVETEFIALKEIAGKAQEPYKSELNIIFTELNEIVERLNKINHENSSLIEQALQIVHFTIDTLTRAEREVVYPQKEGKNLQQSSRIFDSKA
ncbi:MAG: flagellar protein FlgN [Peptococcaceae bacterium]